MQCDRCGQEIVGEAFEDTHSVGPSVHQSNRLEIITLCAECAESRRRIPLFMFLAFCFAIGIVGVLSVVLHWKN